MTNDLLLTDLSLTTDWALTHHADFLGYKLLGWVISPSSILPTPNLDCSTSLGGQSCLSFYLSSSLALLQAALWQPHTPPHSPIVLTEGQIAVACCNVPLNVLRLLATTTATLTCGQSASMARNASLSPKAFLTSTPVNVALLRLSIVLRAEIGCFPQPWRALSIAPSRWSKPSPSSITVQLPAKWEGDVMVQLPHMPENHRDMCANPMMGSGRLPEGRSESVGPMMEASEPLEGRLISNNKVSMSHGHSGQDSDYLACQPVLAQSTQCEDKSSAQEAAQQSLDASVSLMIVHD